MVHIPDVVGNKARAVGARQWLDDLSGLVSHLEQEWSMGVGRPYEDATEAFVAEALLENGTPAVLKLVMPRTDRAAEHEITVLRLCDGNGCPRLFRHDAAVGALLMERLGPPLHRRGLPMVQRHEILCSAAEQIWRLLRTPTFPPAPTKDDGSSNSPRRHGKRAAWMPAPSGSGEPWNACRPGSS